MAVPGSCLTLQLDYFSQSLVQWGCWLLEDRYYLGSSYLCFVLGSRYPKLRCLKCVQEDQWLSGLLSVGYVFCSLVTIAQAGSQPSVVTGSLVERVPVRQWVSQKSGDEPEEKESRKELEGPGSAPRGGIPRRWR